MPSSGEYEKLVRLVFGVLPVNCVALLAGILELELLPELLLEPRRDLEVDFLLLELLPELLPLLPPPEYVG